jgi:hypothetical protein
MADIIPKEALAYLKNKKLQPAFSYKDVWHEEHAAAFTVAKAMQYDVLSDLHMAVVDAMEHGQSFESFKKNIKPVLQQKGWWGKKEMTDPLTGQTVNAQLGSDRRLKTIYSVNTRSAYQKGQYDRTMASDLHPYMMYRIGPSVHHREDHAGWDGLILPKDDPWWDSHFPPNGWGCKCYTRAVTESRKTLYETNGVLTAPRLDGSGGGSIAAKTQAPPVKYKTYFNGRKGTVEKVPEGVDPAFNWNQGKVGRTQMMKSLEEKIGNARKMIFGDTAVFDSIPNPLTEKGIDEIQQASNKVYSVMNDKEKLFVGKYTVKFADRINDYLGTNGKGYVKGEFTKHIKNIDSAVDKFALDKNIIVYRGTDASYYTNRSVGQVFTEKVYYSTSVAEQSAEAMLQFNNAPVMLEIRVPKGAKGSLHRRQYGV